jgi:hypothetical protein
MRTRRQIVCIIISAVFFSAFSCKNTSAQEKFSEEKVKEMLNSFYTSYITVNSIADGKKSDSVVRKYCTPKLINYLDKLYSEPPAGDSYDIFLKSQMVDMPMLENLAIRKDSKKNDLYYVSITYGKGQWTIKLSIVKEKEGYKIDHVFTEGMDDKK